MTQTNPLKECQDVKGFNSFANKLKPDITSNGHRYTYTDSKNVIHTYSRNQLVYQFNKCRKNSESLVSQVKDKKLNQQKSIELVVEINDGLEKIQKLAADKKVTSNWKTKAQNGWFYVTHKGFNASKKLDKLKTTFPQTLPMVIYKIKRSWGEQENLPEFKEIKKALEKEHLNIDLLLQDRSSKAILLDDPVMGPGIRHHEKAKELKKLDKVVSKIMNQAGSKPSLDTLKEEFKKEGFSFDEAIERVDMIMILFKNEALRSRLWELSKDKSLANHQIVSGFHLEYLTDRAIRKYKDKAGDIIKDMAQDFALEGRDFSEVVHNSEAVRLFKNSPLKDVFADYAAKNQSTAVENAVNKAAGRMKGGFTYAELHAELKQENLRLTDAIVMQSVFKNEGLRKGCVAILFVDKDPHIGFIALGYVDYLMQKAKGSPKDLTWFENQLKIDCPFPSTNVGYQEFIKNWAERGYKYYQDENQRK